jgi:hypothetical protein
VTRRVSPLLITSILSTAPVSSTTTRNTPLGNSPPLLNHLHPYNTTTTTTVDTHDNSFQPLPRSKRETEGVVSLSTHHHHHHPPSLETRDRGGVTSVNTPPPTPPSLEMRDGGGSFSVDTPPPSPPSLARNARRRGCYLHGHVQRRNTSPTTRTTTYPTYHYHYKRPKPQIRAFVLDFGVSAPSSCKSYYIYYIVLYYIILYLIKKNPPHPGHGCGFSVGDLKSTRTRTRPTRTRYPCGFVNPLSCPTKRRRPAASRRNCGRG